MNITVVSQKIVQAVLANLCDRRGIGDEIESCDDDVREEIECTLKEKVETILRGSDYR